LRGEAKGNTDERRGFLDARRNRPSPAFPVFVARTAGDCGVFEQMTEFNPDPKEGWAPWE